MYKIKTIVYETLLKRTSPDPRGINTICGPRADAGSRPVAVEQRIDLGVKVSRRWSRLV
jgi:hypothetical protein